MFYDPLCIPSEFSFVQYLKNFFTGTLDGSLSRKFCLQTGYLEIFLAVNLKDWLVVSINFPISMHNFWSLIVPHFSSIAFKEGVVGIKRVVSFSNPRSKKSGSLSLRSELFVSFGDLPLLMSSVLSSSKELSLSSEELSLSSEELSLGSEELSLSSEELSLSSEELSLSSEELPPTLKGISLKKLCNINGHWKNINSRHSLTEREMLVNQKTSPNSRTCSLCLDANTGNSNGFTE